MIVQKLISFEHKPILVKAWQKPKHKSYRQLLTLEKPRKKIENDSDGQNQNFLEKLLKEQKHKKKKHNSKGKPQINQLKDKIQQHRNDQVSVQPKQQTQFRIDSKREPRNDYIDIAFKQDKQKHPHTQRENLNTARDSVFQLDSKFIHKHLQNETQKQNKEQIEQFKVNPQIPSFQVTRRRGLNSCNKKRAASVNKDILIDEKSNQIFKQNVYPFMPKKGLAKSKTAQNLLSKQVHKKIVSEKNFTQTIQKGIILHSIKKQKSLSNHKKQSDIFTGQCDLPLFRFQAKKTRQQLFRTLKQQQLFISSLKQGPNKKYKEILTKQDYIFSNRLF